MTAQARRVETRGRRAPFGRLEEALLLAIVLVGATFPVLREAFAPAVRIFCGLPLPDHSIEVRLALNGKLACAAAIAIALPILARWFARSWSALIRVSPVRSALVVAGVLTSTLTAYDACTGFHASQRSAHGCACWLTALIAGCAALAAALLVLAGRAIVRFLHRTLTAIVEAVFRLRRTGASGLAARLSGIQVSASGVLLAEHRSGRGPPPRLQRAFT